MNSYEIRYAVNYFYLIIDTNVSKLNAAQSTPRVCGLENLFLLDFAQKESVEAYRWCFF